VAILDWLKRKPHLRHQPADLAAGRRCGERRRVGLDVVLSQFGATLRARSVNLSFSGALFVIDDSTTPDLESLSRFCTDQFGGGLTALFGGGVVRRRMEVVRTVRGGWAEDDDALLVACRFTGRLNASECDLLGLDSDETLSVVLLDLEKNRP